MLKMNVQKFYVAPKMPKTFPITYKGIYGTQECFFDISYIYETESSKKWLVETTLRYGGVTGKDCLLRMVNIWGKEDAWNDFAESFQLQNLPKECSVAILEPSKLL